MAAPVFDLAKFGSPPNQYATENDLQDRIDNVSSAIWSKIHRTGELGWVVGLQNTRGPASNLLADTPAAYADMVEEAGQKYLLLPHQSNVGPTTLAIDGRPAQPIIDADGAALVGGELKANRFVLLRFGTGGYRIIDHLPRSELRDLIARAGLLTLRGATGSNAITAQLFEEVERVTPVVGSIYVLTADQSNTGAVSLTVGVETLDVLDADDQPLTGGEIVAGRTYFLRRTGPTETPWLRIIFGAIVPEIVSAMAEARLAVDLASEDTGAAVEFSADGIAYAVTDRLGQMLWGLTTAGDVMAPSYAEFHGHPDLAGIAFALVSEDNYILLAYNSAGQLVHPRDAGSGRSALMPYVSGTDLHAVGAIDTIAADLGSFTALSVAPRDYRAVRAVINRPGLSAVTSVAAGAGLLVPDNDQTLHLVIGLGQSLSVGSQSATTLVNTTAIWPDDALMFDSGAGSDVRMGLDTVDDSGAVLGPASLVGFKPLVAAEGFGRGETHMEGFAYALAELARSIGVQVRSLYFTAGRGATPYAQLQKGTDVYDNMLAAVTRAKDLAEARGWKVVVDGCLVKHGEGDTNSTSYYNNIRQWQTDVNDDLRAITGQAAAIPFVWTQHSSFVGDVGVADRSVRAILGAYLDGGNDHIVAAADYPMGALYASDNLHFTGPGYMLVGEYMAQVWARRFWSTRGFDPLHITAVSRTGTQVTLTYHVPDGPLTFDTTLVPAMTNHGFRYFDSAGEVSISSVSIIDNASTDNVGQVRLNLASTPSGSSERVDYALTPHPGARSNETRPRGNLRDSGPAVSRYDGRRLYNWALHQRFNIGTQSGLPYDLPFNLGG